VGELTGSFHPVEQVEAEVVTAGTARQDERKNGNKGGEGKDHVVEVNPSQWRESRHEEGTAVLFGVPISRRGCHGGVRVSVCVVAASVEAFVKGSVKVVPLYQAVH